MGRSLQASKERDFHFFKMNKKRQHCVVGICLPWGCDILAPSHLCRRLLLPPCRQAPYRGSMSQHQAVTTQCPLCFSFPRVALPNTRLAFSRTSLPCPARNRFLPKVALVSGEETLCFSLSSRATVRYQNYSFLGNWISFVFSETVERNCQVESEAGH